MRITSRSFSSSSATIAWICFSKDDADQLELDRGDASPARACRRARGCRPRPPRSRARRRPRRPAGAPRPRPSDRSVSLASSATVGGALQLGRELLAGVLDARHLARELLRQPEDASVLRERVEDGLAHPPHRVGDELDVALGVEALRGLDEAEVALVDQVEEREAEAPVALRVGDDEAQVGLDEALERLLVARLDAAAQLLLLLGGERLELRDLADVGVQAVARRAERGLGRGALLRLAIGSGAQGILRPGARARTECCERVGAASRGPARSAPASRPGWPARAPRAPRRRTRSPPSASAPSYGAC